MQDILRFAKSVENAEGMLPKREGEERERRGEERGEERESATIGENTC